MDFVEKMKDAMWMVMNACNLNDEWANCQYCPFKEYCDVIETWVGRTPADENFIGEQLSWLERGPDKAEAR